MGALAVLKRGFSSMVTLREKPMAPPEPLVKKPRPATGLLSQLTPEQRKAAFAYKGSEDHGSDEYRNKRK